MRTRLSRRAVLFFFEKQPLSLTVTQSVYLVHQYRISDKTAAVLQALAFTPVVTVYVCVAGAQQQETEPRQDYTPNATAKHTS